MTGTVQDLEGSIGYTLSSTGYFNKKIVNFSTRARRPPSSVPDRCAHGTDIREVMIYIWLAGRVQSSVHMVPLYHTEGPGAGAEVSIFTL